MKSVTIRSSAEPAEYLTYRFQLTGDASSGKAYLVYHRELALHSGRINKKVGVKFGDEDFTFVSQQNSVGVEVGASNALASFTKLADAKGMTLVEKRSWQLQTLGRGRLTWHPRRNSPRPVSRRAWRNCAGAVVHRRHPLRPIPRRRDQKYFIEPFPFSDMTPGCFSG